MSTRIVMLPGLGADSRLFGPQLDAFDSATVPDWLPGEQNEGIGDYSLRFAESVVEPAAGEDWIAVGFSFGGMVALEMACRLPENRRPKAVGIISGIRSHRSITNAFRFQVAVGTLAPGWLAAPLISGPVTGLMARLCGLDRHWSDELHAMSVDVDWPFLRWAARACCDWAFDGRCPVPVAWMHGTREKIVPYVAHPELDDELTLIDDGSHLLTWTQAERVNEWVQSLASLEMRVDNPD